MKMSLQREGNKRESKSREKLSNYKEKHFIFRQPVFNSKGQLESIDSYLDSFQFQHYIILRDVDNLPATLSDALRQWFQLICA